MMHSSLPSLALFLLSLTATETTAYEVPKPKTTSTNRRAFLKTSQSVFTFAGATSTTATLTGSSFLFPTKSYAATTMSPNPQYIGSQTMIQKWPDLQYLVPVYTFDSFLSVLEAQLSPNAGPVGLQRASKLLDRFFEGKFLSKKNVFKGLFTIYIQEIKYDDPDRAKINADRMGRLADCDNTLNALEDMKKPLAQLVMDGSATASPEVLQYLDVAKAGMSSFFSKVPKDDLERVQNWINNVNKADANHNGNLDSEELNALSADDRELYQQVGELIG